MAGFCERLTAVVTNVRLHAAVNTHVPRQVAAAHELQTAKIAAIRTFARVTPHMEFQSVRQRKPLTTFRTTVRQGTRVRTLVTS